ncbi:hypothetical protein J7439_06285 [Salinisphaera sp. G21_0]|nr:hypothetical protein [Salinisphaera sp. G21_0]MBO9481022.1 hypothetical protein [Salinisphaera sp. G21_0]
MGAYTIKVPQRGGRNARKARKVTLEVNKKTATIQSPLLAMARKSRRYEWLKDADSIALQQAIINLDRAFQNFFSPKLEAGKPRFKSKHGQEQTTGLSYL